MGPQNPTPTSKLARAGNRLTRVSQLHYIPRYRIQSEALAWLMGEVVLGLPTLRVVGFGVPCWCGVGGPRAWGVGPAGLLVHALVKYLDPVKKRDLCGPQNPAHGGTKISGDRPHGLSAQGVTSDLATCGPVQDALAQGILDKIHHWGSVVGS